MTLRLKHENNYSTGTNLNVKIGTTQKESKQALLYGFGEETVVPVAIQNGATDSNASQNGLSIITTTINTTLKSNLATSTSLYSNDLHNGGHHSMFLSFFILLKYRAVIEIFDWYKTYFF